MKRVSKKIVYGSVYLIFVSICVTGLYVYLSKPNIKVEKASIPTITPIVEKKVPTIERCFTENKKHMDGLLSIVPASSLSEVFEEASDACATEVCNQFDMLARKELSYERMIQSMHEGDCLNQIYRKAIDYHNEVLSSESVIGIFFDEGSARLSAKHEYKLRVILNTYRVKASEYNLLVIGRASAGGNPDSNKMLSLKRVKSITNYIDELMSGGMQTDYVYFGAEQPRLDLNLAEQYHIPGEDYATSTTSQLDDDYKIRLNQSVLVVIYEKEEDPFQIYAARL